MLAALADLADLTDREAIRDALYRYCRGIDRADEAMLRSAYWPDATDCHGAYRGSAGGFIERALPNLRAGGRGVHQVSNVLSELHGAQNDDAGGPGRTAAVESSFFALQTSAAAPAQCTVLCGRYLDRFEKRGAEWRIAARTVVYDWIEERGCPELASDDATLFGRRQPTGRRDAGDPLYAFLAAVRALTPPGPGSSPSALAL
ncbi:MAG: nuclear transport factor 2 family protein [Rubrivivax sp.]